MKILTIDSDGSNLTVNELADTSPPRTKQDLLELAVKTSEDGKTVVIGDNMAIASAGQSY